MKFLVFIVFVLAAIIVTMFFVRSGSVSPETANPPQHAYVSWDTMEFDKCVSFWLIKRFIDKDAQFAFVPQNTEIQEGVPFDIPGAKWSRGHLKCTSQCILESIPHPDAALEKIVSIAAKTELNFWQLDHWPDAQKCFYEVKKITDIAASPAECFEKTRPYFDRLYDEFKKDAKLNTETKQEDKTQ